MTMTFSCSPENLSVVAEHSRVAVQVRAEAAAGGLADLMRDEMARKVRQRAADAVRQECGDDLARAARLQQQGAALEKSLPLRRAQVDELLARRERIKLEAADGWAGEVRGLDSQVATLRTQIATEESDLTLIRQEVARAGDYLTTMARSYAGQAWGDLIRESTAKVAELTAELMRVASPALQSLVYEVLQAQAVIESPAFLTSDIDFLRDDFDDPGVTRRLPQARSGPQTVQDRLLTTAPRPLPLPPRKVIQVMTTSGK